MKGYAFKELENKVCVVTGGSGVIGSVIVTTLAGFGMKTAVIGRNEEKARNCAEHVSKETGSASIGFGLDVCNKQDLLSAKAEINRNLGTVDVLINCAGGNAPGATTGKEQADQNTGEPGGTILDLDLDEYREVFSLIYYGTLLPIIVFSRDMLDKKQGIILNFSSMSSFRPLTKVPAYSSAKAAVNNLTGWLAVHFAKMNIRVNAIAPGFCISAQNKSLLMDGETDRLTERGKKIITNTPLERFGRPEDFSGAVLFLVSDLSAFVTGITLPVDGGFNAYSGV
jgi:NAD(P)-dependent dehydrogenase (short-subunit alcohol dehydrogenase family)